MILRHRRRALGLSLAALATLLSTPAPATAQTTSARDVLSFLMTTQRVDTDDFVRDQEAAAATRDTIARALLIEMATLPLATSSGGFSYRFNPAIGTVERVTRSFGPLFVNRVATGGRGQTSVSVTYRQSDFIRLDGRELANASLVTTANKFREEPSPFDVDVLSLDLQARTTTFSGNYGLTDAIDVGVAVPVMYVALSGQRINTYHGASLPQATGSATTAGIGDVAVRTKFEILRRAHGGVGADLEVRLPTGSVENLRGSGRVAFRPTLILSAGAGIFDAHANVGIVSGGLSDEVALGGAVSAAVSERVTLSAEGLVRHISELHGVREVSQPHPSFAGVDTIRLLPAAAATTTVMSVAGLRWNVSGPWLVNAYVLMPLRDRGLQPRISPALSVEYSINP